MYHEGERNFHYVMCIAPQTGLHMNAIYMSLLRPFSRVVFLERPAHISHQITRKIHKKKKEDHF